MTSRVVPPVVVFYPSSQRSVSLETVILGLHRRGVNIELLTTCESGPLHALLESQGIPTHAHPLKKRSALVYYARQVLHLVRFTRTRHIGVVFSHLQHANLIASLAQYLIKTRVVLFRHHFHFVFPGDGIQIETSRMERIFDDLINRLGHLIVVPSRGVYDAVLRSEHVDARRLAIVPYAYDFEQYGRPNTETVRAIRSQFPARLTLLMCGRLIPLKRQALGVAVMRELVAHGLDVRMFVLGDGPDRPRLEALVRSYSLEGRVVMLGFRANPLTYMAACDLLIHPSLTEASSNTVKEMSLVGRTTVACQGVGDFDEYLRHGENAFLVPRGTDGKEITEIIRSVYSDEGRLRTMGEAMRTTVLERFSVTPELIDRYVALASGSLA